MTPAEITALRERVEHTAHLRGVLVMKPAEVVALLDAAEERDRSKAALEEIARPGYGLQALLEDGAGPEEEASYWSRRGSAMVLAARAALEGGK